MQKIAYRVAFFDTNTATGPVMLNIGYPPLATPPSTNYLAQQEDIFSLNKAMSTGSAFNRRFQSAGVDCRFEVYGKVIDYTGNNTPAAPTTPVRALTSAEAAEQLYASVDTPDRGLTQRVHLANKSALGTSTTPLDPDFTEDAK